MIRIFDRIDEIVYLIKILIDYYLFVCLLIIDLFINLISSSYNNNDNGDWLTHDNTSENIMIKHVMFYE